MPNNGTRIYSQGGKGIDIRNDVYKVLGIGPRRNGYDVGYACSNQHGKINPLSKRKPYAFGNVSGYTDAEAAAHNWGMTPAAMVLPNVPAWGQWQPPKGGLSEPFRSGDFDGYNQNAKPPVYVENMYFTTNDGKRVGYPTLARRGAHFYGYPYLCCDFSLDPGEFRMSDFHPTWGSVDYFKDFKPTLIFAAWEGREFWPGGVWIAQTEETVSQLSGSYQLRINTSDPDMYAYIVGGDIIEEDGERHEVDGSGRWIAAVCLAPSVYMTNSEGEQVFIGKPNGDFTGNLFSLRFSPNQYDDETEEDAVARFVKVGDMWEEPTAVTPTKTEKTLFMVESYGAGFVEFELELGDANSNSMVYVTVSHTTASYRGYTQLSSVRAYAWVRIYDSAGKFMLEESVFLGNWQVTHDGLDYGHVAMENGDADRFAADISWIDYLPKGQYTMESVVFFTGAEDVGFIHYEADQSYDNVEDNVYDLLCEIKDSWRLPQPCVLYNYTPVRRTINKYR